LTKSNRHCRACNSIEIVELESYSELHRVTSDCRSLNKYGKLYYCSGCGLCQKIISESMEEELQTLYETYETYKDNIEPVIFSSDITEARSSLILNKIREVKTLKKTGIHVDVGCGDGSFLRVFSEVYPGWEQFGFDVNELRRQEIEAVCGVGRFIPKSLDNIPDQVDLITINYVLEHIDKVDEFLSVLVKKLDRKGSIVLVVPDLDRNPFDIVVADHLSHYTKETLLEQLSMYSINCVKQFLQKELMVWIQRERTCKIGVLRNRSKCVNAGKHAIQFLLNVRRHASSESQNAKAFGVFGTAIAGTWLGSELENRINFFVDENSKKSGKLHLGKVILQPTEIPNGSSVYLPFTKNTAVAIKERLEYVERNKFIVPE